jgi:hypothetical protein
MAGDETADKTTGGLGVQLDRQIDPARTSGRTGKSRAQRAAEKIGAAAPSPNPVTNLLIADIVLRGAGRMLRHLFEVNLLKAKYPPGKARDIVKGRGIFRTLAGAGIARVATRSVPGALIVGGGMLAKALYDRSKGPEAKAKGEQAVERRVAKANDKPKKPARSR